MDQRFEIDGVELVCTSARQLASDRLVAGGPSGSNERLRDLADRFAGVAVVLRDLDRSDPTSPSNGRPLAEVVEAQLEGSPMDVVIDATTRGLDPTRATFEALFPLLGPGGIFVVESWNADQTGRDVPREHLVIELMLARACSDGAVERITVDGDWMSVVRGDAPLDAATFRIAARYTDHFDQLAPGLSLDAAPPSTP